MTKRKTLAVIDGKSVFYRGYYAMPNLSTKDGTPTGGVFGFATLAIELIKKLDPDYVAVAWDKPKTNIRKRREIYPDYKAGRKPAPADFYEQIPILHELLDAFGWPFYELDDYEADDILGAFARQATERDIDTYLLTSDLDALQLISPTTKVYALKNGLSNIEEFDVAYFENKYGIRVEQFLDLKSLKGDSSDNLPGVPGVGEKTAVSLLQDWETLDNIYAHLDAIKPTVAKKLEAGKEAAYMTKEVGRLWIDAPVELDWDVADVNDTDLARVAEILKRLEFSSLVRRLPKHMQSEPEKGALYFGGAEAPTLKESDWPDTLSINGPVAVWCAPGDELWVSIDQTTVFHRPIKDISRSVWRTLELATIVTYDVKELYHVLAKLDVHVRFSEVHDIRQGAFLIDPLRRDRSLEALVGEVLEAPHAYVAGLWRVYSWQLEAFEHTPKIGTIARKLDFPLTYILFAMERRGIKLDLDAFAEIKEQTDTKLAKLEQEIYTSVGQEFNIGSPKQLGVILFEVLDLPTAGVKKGKSGAYSTNAKVLEKLRFAHPAVEKIVQHRELAKLKNTYIDTLPELIGKDGRLHTNFHQDVTATGRLSSSEPNLQNIPVRTEAGREIRRGFVPEKGKVFVSADYSQFELRLAAVLADDTELVEDFNSDIDIHTKTASEVYGVPLEQVSKDQRRAAKVINFGVLYGMSPHGLAAATGMTFGEAKKFIDQYFALRAPIRNYIDATLKKAKEDGYVETHYGRRRPTPDLHSSNFIVRQGAERAAANMPIQGTEADLMKLAMLKVDEELGSLGEQILQIHDSILIETDEANVDTIEGILKNTMETIAPDLGVKLKVDIYSGRSWRET